MLLAGFFTLPIGLLVYLFVGQSLKDISLAKLEIQGAAYLGDIWPNVLHPDAPLTSMDARADYDRQFGTSEISRTFVEARTPIARIDSGRLLMQAVSDATHLTLDPELESKYAAEAININIPVLVRAAETLLEAYREPKNETRLVNIVSGKDRVRVRMMDVAATLNASMKGSASETRKSVAPGLGALQSSATALIEEAEKIASGGEGTGFEAVYARFIDRADELWRATQKELPRILQARIDTLMADLLKKLAFVVACLIATGALLFAIVAGITRPLRQLTGGMHKLADGEFDTVLPGLDRGDEIGLIARAVESFKVKAEQKARDEAEETARRHAQEAAAKAEIDAERQKVAAEQAQAMEELGAALIRLAAKDLTSRVAEDIPEAYRKLRDDFNTSIAQLGEALRAVSDTSHNVHSGTLEISTAANELSRRAEQQAASLEETAAALDQITQAVRQTAEGAKQAQDAVASAGEDARKSGEVVREAVDAMGKIAASSRQMGQIIGVIDEIAFQTNLLALNAGVEAARAGDAGRGFAVVASEVRALAQRSAEAAKEIKTLIMNSGKEVDDGVVFVTEAGSALERIARQVGEVNRLVTAISSSAQEQATGLQEINTAANQMDHLTQENAAMAEETTAASKTLSAQSEQLNALIGQFTMDGDGERLRAELVKVAPHAFREKAQAPERPARAPAAAPARVKRQPVRQSVRQAAASGAKSAPAGDEWVEF